MKGRTLTCLDAEPHEGMERVGSYGFNICTNGDEPLNQLGHLFHFLIKPNEDILLERNNIHKQSHRGYYINTKLKLPQPHIFESVKHE